METRKIDYKFIKKCVRDDSEWVKGARQEHRQSSSSDQYNLVEKKEEGALIRSDCRLKKPLEGIECFQ